MLASCSRYSATSASSPASASRSRTSPSHWKCSSTSAASMQIDAARLRGVCGWMESGSYHPFARTNSCIRRVRSVRSVTISLFLSTVITYGYLKTQHKARLGEVMGLSSDASQIIQYLKQQKIRWLVHWTCIDNLPMIRKFGGLASKEVLERNGCWPPPSPGGNQLSHDLDRT